MAKGTLKQKQDTEDKTQVAYKYYRSQGWTPEQASGIVGNLLRESNLNPNAVGDGGKARGLAQWHPDRQAKAKELYGDRWTDFENQLKFVNWELNNTEKKAGDKLRNAKSVWESGAVISNDYERPKVKFHADDTRQAHVSDIYRKYSKTQLTDADKQMFRASYARDVAPYMNQPTNNLTNFEIPTSSGTFASVPDVYKEPAKEENKEVAELQQKSAEKNFIEAYQSLQKQPIAQQEQEEAVQALPQKDIMDTFNEVSSFIDEPVIAQEGGTWTTQQAKVKAEKDAKLKLLLKQEKNIVQKLIDEKGKKKQEPLKTQDNTKVNTKNRPELFSKVARKKTDKEIAEERQAKIDESIKYQDVPYTQDNWREVLAKTTQATGDKFRIFPEEDSFIDNYLNPGVWLGSMASNLGQAPLQAEESDSLMPYITSIGMPLAVGALAGLGTQNTGQFVNNLTNPLAGTGDLAKGLYNKVAQGETFIPYAWKSPAVGLTQEQSYNMFNNIKGGENITEADKVLLAEYQYNSKPFTGRGGWLEKEKQDKLNKLIKDNPTSFKEDTVLTRRVNPENKELFSIENNRLNLENRPTSFSAGVGIENYGSKANDRIVLSGKNAQNLQSKMFKNNYSEILDSTYDNINNFTTVTDPGFTGKTKIFPNGDKVEPLGEGFIRNLKNTEIEKEIIGTNLNLKRIGKVKNDIGGYDHIMKSFQYGGEATRQDNATITPNYQEGGKVVSSTGVYDKNEFEFLKALQNLPINSKGVFASGGKPVIVPSPNISMKNVNYPILAQSLETGEEKTLYPNLEYFFKNTKNVLEIPIKNK